MTVETASLISDLNPLLPDQSDGMSEGDNHIRLLKSVIKATFPNINAAVTATDEILNNIRTATAALDALSALTPAANKLPYFNGVSSATLADLSAFARTLLDDADAAAGRATLAAAGTGVTNTFTSNQIVDAGTDSAITIRGSGSGILRLGDTGAAADAKTVDIFTDSGELIIRSLTDGGAAQQRLASYDMHDGGFKVGSPDGAYKGAGTVNAEEYYKDGVSLGYRVLQRLHNQSNTPAALASRVIPDDNTTPLSTEGTEAFSQAVTPISAASTIRISGVVSLGASSASVGTVIALFSGTTCLAVFPADNVSSANDQIAYSYEEASGSASARTYSLRYGSAGGTVGINNHGGGAGDYGNKCTSTMTIEEYLS